MDSPVTFFKFLRHMSDMTCEPEPKHSREANMNSASEQIMPGPMETSLTDLLHEYRMHLAPGAYYFLGKYESGCLADIAEIHVPFTGQPSEAQRAVIFAFLEKGYPPADAAKKGYEHWRNDYPFSHDVASTSGEFHDKLAAHVSTRLRKPRVDEA
jgi:hypothetical protein